MAEDRYEGLIAHLVRRVTVLGLLATCLVVIPVAAAEAAAPNSRRTTPQLLDEAVAQGEMNRETADLHLAEVFAGRGRSAKVPAKFQADRPWDGTIPLLRLRERTSARPAGVTKARTDALLAASTTCDDSTAELPNETSSTHFAISYDTVGGGLTASSFLTSLEAAYSKQVGTFGWAAPPSLTSPPPIGTKHPVRLDDTFSGGLYGFVSTVGTGAGWVGDNPNTTWNDLDAYAACMVLNNDYSGFPGSPQQALDATTAHELNHMIQYGYGAIVGNNVPDDSLFEASATWMEDEVFDGADDSYGYLWPDFGDSLGDYDGSPYPLWIVLRGLTERFGTGGAGGGEQVLQDFWESTSKNTGNNLSALALGLQNKGVTLPNAYHDVAIAAGFQRACAGGYSLPHCFQEAAGYLATAGLPEVHGTIPAAGGTLTGVVEDDYSLAWVTLPPSAEYSVTLSNTASGGQLRATAVCDTGTALVRSPLPAVLGAGTSTTLPRFNSRGCVRSLAVITNQQQSVGNPSDSPSRAFRLSTGLPVPDQPQPIVMPGGNGVASSPDAAAVRGSSRVDFVVRGTDNSVYLNTWNGSAWSGYGWLGSPNGWGIKGDPAVVSWAPGRLDVFVRGADDKLWQRFSTNGGGSWSGWFKPLGDQGVLASGPDAAASGPNRLDVFVRGTDGQLYQRSWNGSSWGGGWMGRGGYLSGDPTVVSWGPGRLDVFARGMDGKLWQTFTNSSGWSGWFRPPGTEAGTLAAPDGVGSGVLDGASWGVGHVSVFVRSTDNQVWETRYQNGWLPWARPVNDAVRGGPGATSRGAGQLDVFARAADGSAHQYRLL